MKDRLWNLHGKASPDIDREVRAENCIDAVLHELGVAEANAGLEERILRRLSAPPAVPLDSRAAWFSLRFALPVAAVLCLSAAVGVFVLHHTGAQRDREQGALSFSGGASGAHKSPTTPQAMASAFVAPKRRFISPARPRVWRTTGTERDVARSGQVRGEKPAESAAVHEASFPAPEMPLTEQERSLLAIAHRNDPVEVAMLNPVERSVRLTRERAETARFFAEAPLPPELQQQIDAAVRSQYVNTPPPSTKQNDRSLP